MRIPLGIDFLFQRGITPYLDASVSKRKFAFHTANIAAFGTDDPPHVGKLIEANADEFFIIEYLQYLLPRRVKGIADVDSSIMKASRFEARVLELVIALPSGWVVAVPMYLQKNEAIVRSIFPLGQHVRQGFTKRIAQYAQPVVELPGANSLPEMSHICLGSDNTKFKTAIQFWAREKMGFRHSPRASLLCGRDIWLFNARFIAL